MRPIKLKNWFRDMSIGVKIPLLGCSMLLLALILVLIFNTVTVRGSVSEYLSEVSEKKNNLVSQRIRQMMENAEDMSALILYNDNVQSNLPLSNVRRQMETEYSIQYFIENVLENSVGISNIVLYRGIGGVITSNYINVKNLNEQDFAEQFAQMVDSANLCVWEDMHDNNYHIFPGERAAVTLYRNIISLYTGERIGMMAININEYNIAKCYEEEVNADTQMFIIDANGKIISSTDRKLLYQPIAQIGLCDEDFFTDENGTKHLVSRAPVGEMDWTVVRMDNYNSSMSTFAGATRLNIFTGLVVLAVMALLTFMLTRRVTAPILYLSQIMDSAEEEVLLGEEVIVHTNDEVGRLTHSFRNMQRRISVLIERIRFEQEQKGKLEMLSLQTQIKPHFLYNTMESVCALIQLNRSEDAILMLKSIENFYRGTLSKGSYKITIGEEINITKQYVRIQSYRYFGKLEVNYFISAEVEHCLIPKLTLQPFVENAIYHGLKNGGRDGRIEIRERHDGNTIIITVTDNGDGYDTNSARRPDDGGRGYGIVNIQNSIQSCFGKEYGVHIKSTPGEGSIVFIRIPMQQQTQEERS